MTKDSACGVLRPEPPPGRCAVWAVPRGLPADAPPTCTRERRLLPRAVQALLAGGAPSLGASLAVKGKGLSTTASERAAGRHLPSRSGTRGPELPPHFLLTHTPRRPSAAVTVVSCVIVTQSSHTSGGCPDRPASSGRIS